MTSFKERILRSADANGSRVVLALDFTDPIDERLGRAQAVLEATKDDIAAVKINHQLILPFGLRGLRDLVEACKKAGLPLIADLKMNDIESTNLDMVESLFSHGFDCVIANPFVGKEEGLGKVVERVHSLSGGIVFLVYMSHRGSEEGYGLRTQGGDPMYRVFAERARDWKADGVVVSARSPEKIAETRTIVGMDCLIFSPGTGAQGGDAKAGSASGADFLIVGRMITGSGDPRKVVLGLNAM